MGESTSLRTHSNMSFTEIQRWDEQFRTEMFSSFEETQSLVTLDTKMEFWMKAIGQYCRSTRTATFNIQSLMSYFDAELDRTPRCLPSVINYMISIGSVELLCEVMRRITTPAPPPRRSLLARVFERFFKGSSDANSPSRKPETLPSTSQLSTSRLTFVLLDAVEGQASAIRRCQLEKEFGQETISYRNLRRESAAITGDDASLQLAIWNLQNNGQCNVHKVTEGSQFVTFVREFTEFRQPTEAQIMAYELQEKIQDLEEEIDNIYQGILRNIKFAKEHKSRGNTKEAMRFMRMKHVLDSDQERKNLELNQLMKLLNTIEQTNMSIKLYQLNKVVVRLVKGMKTEAGLTADSADDTIVDVHEMMDDNHQLNDMLREPFFCPSLQFNDEDLERELNQFMNEDLPSTSTAPQPTGANPRKRPQETQQESQEEEPFLLDLPLVTDEPQPSTSGLNSQKQPMINKYRAVEEEI